MLTEITEGEESEILLNEADTEGKKGILSLNSTEITQKAHHDHSYQEFY